MVERRAQRVVQFVGLLDPHAEQPGGPGDPGEVGVGQIGAVGDDPARLHLQLDERQRAVVEHDDLDRKLLLAQREQLAEQHREPAVAGQRDRPGARAGGLGADGVRQRVGHGAVVERADQPAGAVHPQVAGGPDARGADVDGEDGVVGGEPVDGGRDVLRVQRRAVAAGPGQPVQPGAGPPVVRGHPVQVRGVGLGPSSGSRASTVSLTVPTSGTCTGTRRPICSPRTSTWITGTPSG